MFALLPEERTTLWSRPISETALLMGVDDRHLYLLSEEVLAIDRRTRKLAWANQLPTISSHSLVVMADSVLVPTVRGVFRLSKTNGDVETIYRTRAEMGDVERIEADGEDVFVFKKGSLHAYLTPRDAPAD